MVKLTTIYFYLFVFLTIGGTHAFAQSSCPVNIDFGLGDFTNWECRSGRVFVDTGFTNSVKWNRTGQEADKHQIISSSSNELDDYGKFPKRSPSNNSYSVQLGNPNVGAEAEGLFYTFTIPANNNKFSLLYYYAIVMQNPGHDASAQPRFRARVIDVATETAIHCVSFDFTSSGSLPGFKQAGIGDAIYKEWTPISVDLSGLAGKTVRLEFITSDCVPGGHFGYAYISVGSFCSGSISGGNYCEGDSTTTVRAPHGFRHYAWYSDSAFTRRIGSQQELFLNINTTGIGSVIPVILTPHAGYGCIDTLYVVIENKSKPISEAGIDKLNCSKVAVQLGTLSNSNYAYSWTPKENLSNSMVANPFTLPGLQVPKDFIVRTEDLLTGCISFDTVLVTPILVDTSTSFTGELVYCPGESLNSLILVNNPDVAVQWFNGQHNIQTATSSFYRPNSVGTYWAETRQFGCVDSSRKFVIYHAPLPKADFITNKEIQCLNEPVEFLNATTIVGNEPVKYLWKFHDGLTSQAIHADKTFTAPGSYTTTLVATSGTDCVDSIQKKVTIVNDCTPVFPTAFTPNKDGKNDELRPFLPGAKGLKRFTVYNRWGNIVFSTTRENLGWDGTHRGMALETDVFVWIVEYVGKDNKNATQKGTVTLIR